MATNPVGVGIGAVVVIALFFLLVNADPLFGAFSGQAMQTLTIYSILLIGSIALFRSELPLINAGISKLFVMILTFAVTLLITASIPASLLSSIDPVKALTAAAGFAYGFIKAFVEEVVFRNVMMNRIGLEFQAVLFGIFHAAVLIAQGFTGATLLLPVMVLTLLGYIWGILKKHVGIEAAIGSHVGWNAAVQGLRGAFLGPLA